LPKLTEFRRPNIFKKFSAKNKENPVMLNKAQSVDRNFLLNAGNSGFRVKIRKYSFSDFSRNDSFFYGFGLRRNIPFLTGK
jgi:hypothetical protein